MKNLILKFKHWLIKKLGGYTEQHVSYQRVEMRTHNITPIVLRNEMRVDLYMLSGRLTETNVYDQFKRDLVYKLADKIVEENLATITWFRLQLHDRSDRLIFHPVHVKIALPISCAETTGPIMEGGCLGYD